MVEKSNIKKVNISAKVPPKAQAKKVEFSKSPERDSSPIRVKSSLKKSTPVVEEQKIDMKSCKRELDASDTAEYIQKMWKSWFVKGLKDFVRVPNTTPRTNPEYCND